MIRLSIHPSRYPDASTARLRRALEARVLPGRFLYDSPAQAGRWLAYHQAYSPSRTDGDVEALYAAAFEATVSRMPARFTVVGLGCGGGRKDARLLRAARSRGEDRRADYAPVDTSPSLVVQSALTADDEARSLHPLVVDLEAPLGPEVFGPDASPRLFTAMGMVPNFELDAFGPRLAGWMVPNDAALISFNLSPGPLAAARDRIVPQYDNAPARAWLWGALSELGLSSSNARLAVAPQSLSKDDEVWRIEAWCELTGRVTSPMPWGQVHFSEGDRLRALISNRLTADAAERALCAWGLSPEARWISDSNEEGIWLVRRG